MRPCSIFGSPGLASGEQTSTSANGSLSKRPLPTASALRRRSEVSRSEGFIFSGCYLHWSLQKKRFIKNFVALRCALPYSVFVIFAFNGFEDRSMIHPSSKRLLIGIRLVVRHCVGVASEIAQFCHAV